MYAMLIFYDTIKTPMLALDSHLSTATRLHLKVAVGTFHNSTDKSVPLVVGRKHTPVRGETIRAGVIGRLQQKTTIKEYYIHDTSSMSQLAKLRPNKQYLKHYSNPNLSS